MENKYNIFAKKKPNIENKKKILSKDEIMSSIPNNAIENEDINLSLSKTEYRWRIFKIPDIENDIIEISHKIPNQKRNYINQNGEWSEYNDDGKFDHYIIKTLYYYQ